MGEWHERESWVRELRRKRFLQAAGVAFGLFAFTTASARAEVYLGTGGVLCSQYADVARKQDPLYYTYSQWMLGYVSGMNMAWKEAKGWEPLTTIPTNNLLQYASARCATNPSVALVSIATEWFTAIPKTQGDAQAVAKGEVPPPPKGSGSGMWIDLDKAPSGRPLLDRH
jgi:hypothetical protein